MRKHLREAYGTCRRGLARSFFQAVALCFLWTAGSLGQPFFDVASVKMVGLASHPVFGNRGGPGTSDPDRIHLCCVGMFSLLMRAYGVEIDQIAGPAWIMENSGPNLYEIDATMPPGTTGAQFQLMMRNMLKERFHLQMHRESRSFPGYELVLAKGGPRLQESTVHASTVIPENTRQTPTRLPDASVILPPGPQMLTSLGRGMIRVQVQDKPIGDLAKSLGRLIAQSLGENMSDFASRKPRVTDKTGLNGKYDFTLEFSCEGCGGIGAIMAATNGGMVIPSGAADSFGGALPNIFSAIEKQLGLELVKTKDIPLDFIVVDRVDKAPTGN